MSDLWWTILKYQTSLPQFDPELDHTTGYAGVPPVQMASAQHPQHYEAYLQGQYPKEFWAFPGKEASVAHGAAPHRSDEEGRFLDVGVRSFSPVGTKQKVGRMVHGEDMPDKRSIVVRRRSAADHPRFQRDLDKRLKREAMKRKKNLERLRRRNPLHGTRGLGLRKEAKSPKALAHKRKYETQYESSPARKKYRRDLERERRKRGVAGKGGKDMSHTKRGTIVPEDPHTNRARSHPSVGSTLKMVVIKSPQMNLFGQSAECELCKAPMSGQEAAVSNQQFGASVCTPCIMKEQEEINQANDMMFHGEPMDIAMRLLKEQKKLFVQGQKTLDGRPAFVPTDFAAEEQRRQAALKEQRAREAREAQRRKNAVGLTPLPHFQQNSE